MVNKKEYILLENKSLIIESYVGNFNVDELIEFKINVADEKKYNPNFNIIHDLREAEFLFNIEEISKYISLLSNNNKFKGNRKSAFITKTPNQVVTTLGFEFLKKDLPIQVKVCSTLETSFSFLEIPKNEWETLESLINSLNV